MKIKAVIFDYDGVICDTETNTIGFKVEYLASKGIYVTEEWIRQFVGQTFSSVLKRHYPEREDIEEVIKEYYIEKEKRKPPYEEIFFKDTLDLLKYCKEHNIVTAVASNSNHIRLVNEITNLELLPYFKKLISSDLAELMKPDPRFYEYVLDQLHISKDEAIIIEDSVHGIEAAKGAGVFTFARKANESFIDQSQADRITDDYHDVIDYIHELNSCN